MTETPITVPLFDFMDVRAPQALSARRRRRGFIDDRDAPQVPATGRPPGLPPQDEFPAVSPIAAVVLQTVTAWQGSASDPAALEQLHADLIANYETLQMKAFGPVGSGGGPPAEPGFRDLETGKWLTDSGTQRLYLLPDHPARLDPPSLYDRLAAAGHTIKRHVEAPQFDLTALRKDLERDLHQGVDYFAWGPQYRNDDSWLFYHRRLFDALYLLYVCRRWVKVSLEPIIEALQALHVISVLGADLVVENARAAASPLPASLEEMLISLVTAWSELGSIDKRQAWEHFPLITTTDDIRGYATTAPVVHRMFAQLFWRNRPFNDIKPIGCGDLKVVRDRLDRYLAVDIADIQNIMMGETRTRTHRRHERTETAFTLEAATSTDTTKDTQTAERFEVKAETEKVIRDQQNLNVNANASLTLGNSGDPVQFTASAGLAYASSRSFEDHLNTARTFGRDIVNKAVERVETKHAVSRSTTSLVETWERNLHTFQSKTHTSGIYQWVEAEYTAQVFSYGRRTMFEFVVPEPAAFWATAKLRGYEDTMKVPQPPTKPARESPNLGFTWDQINSRLFATLSLEYGIHDLTEPVEIKRVQLRTSDTSSMIFSAKIDPAEPDPTRYFETVLEGGRGYRTEFVSLHGGWTFNDKADATNQNMMTLIIDGIKVYGYAGEIIFVPGENHPHLVPEGQLEFTDDHPNLTVQFNNPAKGFDLTLALTLKRTDETYTDWQHKVFDLVEDVEKKRVAQRNAERQVEYDNAVGAYRTAIAELQARPVVELLAGGSQAENRRVIETELKKHCITMIAKEFDMDGNDDVLEALKPMGSRVVKADRTRLQVTEDPDLVAPSTAGYVTEPQDTPYPLIDVATARKRGRLVQFIDQAFEWEKISYLFFDYFYANMPRWVELINREDTDPVWGAFLSAGKVRVLVAVTPKHEVAVQHFLDTREPWEGTDSDPVIDDPLFVPLFDEIRSRTDDRSGGTPCGSTWTYRVPISLPYLRGSDVTLPDLEKDRQAAGGNPP